MDKGIDLNNPKDDFFNDFCYPFFDEENGRDVTLKDRRAYFFENNTLCENNCSYVQIDFKTTRVDYSCKVKTSSYESITENIPFDDFPSSLNMQNLIVVRCYNLVFNWTYMKINIGTWLILAMIISQIVIAINFVRIGFTPIYSFLNQFSREHFDVKSIEENQKIESKSSPPIKSEKDENDCLNNVEIYSSRQFSSPDVPFTTTEGKAKSKKNK